MQSNIASIRENYSKQTLSEVAAAADPIVQFSNWWNDAIKAELTEANAMTLATASADGMPSARIVLLKGFSNDGFVFFTNYESFKGQQLAENPRACLVFFWKELERQVRITGIVQKVTTAESDEYFSSRPAGSQIGAMASPQSQVIENREWLEKRYDDLATGHDTKTPLQRPAHWGGYIVKPVIIEFWQGRPSRLHDRLQYSLQQNGSWKMERLAP